MNRQEAKALGCKRFQGNPCKHGHSGERLTSNGGCVTCCRQQSSYWGRANPKAQHGKLKKWRRDNREKYKDWSKKWRGRPETKVSIALRNTLKRMTLAGLEGLDEISSQDVGYRPSDLVSHIERLWKDGMSWENYGDWHIDHIKPVAAFVREGVTNPSVVNALDNLQPLWSEENFKKGDTYE